VLGKGLATQGLNRMLHLVVDRPIFARAATDNIGSIRVLQKCGFKIIGKNKDFANGRGEDTEEYILRLDLDQANDGISLTSRQSQRIFNVSSRVARQSPRKGIASVGESNVRLETCLRYVHPRNT